MGARAEEILRCATSQRVLTVWCADVPEALDGLRSAAEQRQPAPTLVTLSWVEAPGLAHELSEIRDALCDAAHSLWPDWYLSGEARITRTSAPAVPELEKIRQRATDAAQSASLTWLGTAWSQCAANEAPRQSDLPLPEQVRQLAIAMDPEQLVLVLSIESPNAPTSRMRGVARAAEWLVQQAGARTLLLLPQAWRDRAELDHVSYGAVSYDARSLPSESPLPGMDGRADSPPGTELRSALPSGAAPKPNPEPHVQVLVGPIGGRPHPNSDAEKRLYEYIEADPELRTLFEYNQQLQPASTGGSARRYIVDLLWRDGGLVIELDGDEHRGALKFYEDRDRDYRLFMTGYATLRIPNPDVLSQPDAVLDKIRNMVRLRAKQTRTKEPMP